MSDIVGGMTSTSPVEASRVTFVAPVVTVTQPYAGTKEHISGQSVPMAKPGK